MLASPDRRGLGGGHQRSLLENDRLVASAPRSHISVLNHLLSGLRVGDGGVPAGLSDFTLGEPAGHGSLGESLGVNISEFQFGHRLAHAVRRGYRRLSQHMRIDRLALLQILVLNLL